MIKFFSLIFILKVWTFLLVSYQFLTFFDKHQIKNLLKKPLKSRFMTDVNLSL